MKRDLSTILFVFLIILIIIFGFFLVYKNGVKEIKAGSDDNVWGWAWSENIGWISFNNTSGGGTIDYGVNIGSDGIFSGYAWSENIGWLSFNPSELINCPLEPCQGEMNLETGEVSGWAKILSLGDNGWIRLRDSNYGVSVDTATGIFSGWAWSDNIGWISFNSITGGGTTDYKVETSFDFNRAPTATTNPVDQGDYCTTPLRPTFSWTFSDPDPGDTQGAYQIQIDGIDSDKVLSSSESYSPAGGFSFNKTYNWQLKVWDNHDEESGWISGPLFTTPAHAYPDPDFIWSPTSPSEGEEIQFCAIQGTGICTEDPSTCYSIGGAITPPSCTSTNFLWIFPAGTEFATGSSATSKNPQVRFTTTGDKNVSLNISDGVGSCTTTKSVGVALPLPKWKEIKP